MSAAPIVYLVDDDPDIRSSLALLLNSVAIDVKTYPSAAEFLADFQESSSHPALLLLDVRMPGTSGMVLLERLRAQHPSLPIVIITGHGDIDMAVQAMKLGALDFITKPFAAQRLLDLIQPVLSRARQSPASADGTQEAAARLATLTVRERDIYDRIVGGGSNKAIALDLGISIRTVESHRANIMRKLKARTLVDLVRLALNQDGTRDRPAPAHDGPQHR